MIGSNVCGQHGALAPAVQARAATRIQMSVDDAAKRLLAMVEDAEVESRDKIKILHDLLDRGGLAATSKLLVGVVTEDPVEKLFASILSDPRATYDPATVVPGEVVPDALQAAIDAYEDEGDWEDLFGPENGSLGTENVVDAELAELPLNTVRLSGSMSHAPPKHIREALERLL